MEVQVEQLHGMVAVPSVRCAKAQNRYGGISRTTAWNGSCAFRTELTHLCRPVRSTFAVRETASLGIMGAPRVPPLNPSESIVL